MERYLTYFAIFFLLFPLARAVTIQGTVYDFALNPVQNAVVEINTTPRQVFVAKNATYQFTVPPGQYLLQAHHEEADIQENITALQEGKYTLDLILFPTIEMEETPEVSNYETYLEEKTISHPNTYLFLAVLILLGIISYFVLRKPPKIVEVHKEHIGLPSDLHQVLRFIEEQDGRTTQKDIRNQFPQSEAKISLMLDELETKGLIQKIKKGRGNIIVRK